MKPLVIYHDSCADGFGAAFAAWLKLGDEAEYVPMQYGNIDVDLECVGREVYILDFSFPRVMMDNIFHAAKRVVWLDHHKTAFEMWCGKYEKGMLHFEASEPSGMDCFSNASKYISLDDSASGAKIAWRCFHPGTGVPMLIKHIDDYDRWVFALNGTKEINKALWSFAPWSFAQWQEIIDDDQYGSMWSQGTAILRAHEQNVQSVVEKGARKCVIEVMLKYPDGTWHEESDLLPGLAANCPPHLTSDVGHELANQSGTFGLLWCLDKDNVCKCSLRSNGDYDVSAIAKVFGGGGHRNAAGFQIDIQTLLGWLK